MINKIQVKMSAVFFDLTKSLGISTRIMNIIMRISVKGTIMVHFIFE